MPRRRPPRRGSHRDAFGPIRGLLIALPAALLIWFAVFALALWFLVEGG